MSNLKLSRVFRRPIATFVALLLAFTSLSAAANSAGAAVTATSSSNSSNESASVVISHPTAVAGALSATVSYKAPKNASGLTYRVRYSSNKGKAWTTFATTTSALSLRVAPLTAGTSYTFQVSAKKSASWGSWSEDSNAVKPTGGAPASFTILASASVGGTVTPAGVTTVASGGSQTYTFTPNSGFQISSVLLDGSSVGSAASYTVSNVTANHTILANFAAVQYGITSSAGAHGTITPAGTTNVFSGLSQTYTITPDTGYHVADVLVDGSTAGAVTTYTFSNVTTTHTISATFAINTFNISAGVDYGNGTISSSGITAVNYGSSKTYTITPDAGYRLNDIYVDGSLVSNAASYTFSNVTTGHTILVSFVLDQYTITAGVDFGSGTISSDGETTVAGGSSKTYTITPSRGFQVNELYIDNVKVANSESYTFNSISANHTILVSFTRSSWIINAGVDYGNGTITPAGQTDVAVGGSQTYTITADAGYRLNDIYVDGSLVSNAASYTFSNVTTGHTILVSFVLDQYTITAGVDFGSGTISSDGETTVAGGSSKTYTITPDVGYVIGELYVDGDLVTSASSYTFSNVAANHNILVSFTLGFTITAGVNSGPGSISSSGVSALASGSNKTYTFTPNANSFVSDVLIDGVSIGAYYTYTFSNVTSDHTVYVEFEATSYDLYADVDYGSGTVSPSGYHTVYNGDDQTYEFTPDEGYYVYNVTVDGVSVGGVNSYTFTNVKSTHEVWVGFELLRDYTINAGVDYGDGSISETGDVAVGVTTDKTFTFTPSAGNHIVDVLVDGESQGAITTFTFTNVRRNHSIYVQFEVDPYVPPTDPTFTITYNSNVDHSGTSSTSHTQTGLGDVSVDYNDYTAENGAHFWGWNTQANAQGTYYYPEDTYALNADVTLYAIWTYDITVTTGALDAGPFSSAYATFKCPDVSDPANDKTVTFAENETKTITVLAGALYPYQLLFTGTWVGSSSNYTGTYVVTLTDLTAASPQVYTQATMADGPNLFTGIYVPVNAAAADGSILIEYTLPG